MAHLPLVRHTLSRLVAHLPPGIDLENLEAAGTLGLVEAAGKFDGERGVKFETFATWRIRGAVFDELRRNCPLPRHLLERVGRVRQAYKQLPPPVSMEALASATGLMVEEVSDCLAALRMTRRVSWDNFNDPRQDQHPIWEDPAEAGAEWEDQKTLLAQGIAQLPERERLVVTLYYLEELRLKEIGQSLSLSESRVCRLLNAALFTLGEFLRAKNAA
jgi:RNA polymerase sigma factor for flagellar operon FliA